MKMVHKITSAGFFVEDVILSDDENVPSDCVTVQAQPGFYWPKWDGTQWVEGGGLYRKESDGSVNPAKRYDAITAPDGSSVKRDVAGVVTVLPKLEI